MVSMYDEAARSRNGSADPITATQFKAVGLLSRELAYELDVLPLSYENNLLVVGISNPADAKRLEKIARHTRTEVDGRQLDVPIIREGLRRLYPVPTKKGETVVEQLLEDLIKRAIRNHVSDIHIEPYGPSAGLVRMRIDDILDPVKELERDLYERLVANIKVKSGIDISERLLPLDGALSMNVDGRQVDMRVTTITGIAGQKVAIRVLGQFELIKSLYHMGMPEATADRLMAGVNRASSFVLISGPTGSGKTTLLYSLLRQLDMRALAIYSAEDPVEMPVIGMTQVKINDKGGLTFAESLRSFVRLDPDLILIGELRDKDTARECLAASTTGLKLLATTHAKSAVHIIDRIVELKGKRSRVADSLTMGVAMRLLRLLCNHCKQPAALSVEGEAIRRKYLAHDPIDKVSKPKGCEHCVNGWVRRFCVIELLSITPEVQDVIKTTKSPLDIARVAAKKGGYEPMVVDALRHVLAGDTSEEELLRKLAYEDILI